MRVLVLSLLLFTAACSGNYPPLDTVDEVDILRYLGKWHEIARLPNTFQSDCYCASAEYQIIDESTLSVRNECREDSLNGEIDFVEGKAFVVEGSNNSKLLVQFFWPFKGDYWIIDLDGTNYEYAVVGTPSRKYLWILARDRNFNKDLLARILERIESKGFDTSKLIYSDRDC